MYCEGEISSNSPKAARVCAIVQLDGVRGGEGGMKLAREVAAGAIAYDDFIDLE